MIGWLISLAYSPVNTLYYWLLIDKFEFVDNFIGSFSSDYGFCDSVFRGDFGWHLRKKAVIPNLCGRGGGPNLTIDSTVFELWMGL